MAVQNPVREIASPLKSSSLPEPSLLPQRAMAMADAHRHLLFLAVGMLYLVSFNGQWRVERDSALYLSIGHNLAAGEGYTYQGQPHHLAFPGLPLLFAGLFRLFRTESVLPALIVMLLMGFAIMGLMYRLFLLHAGRPTAVLMTAGLGVTRVFHRYCFELLSDLPFLLGVMAFFCGYEAIFHRRRTDDDPLTDTPPDKTLGYARPHARARARWFDWIFLIGGFALAVAMRPAMWVLLAAIGLAVLWSLVAGAMRGKLNWGHLLIGLAVAAATLLFLWIDPRSNNSRSLPQYEDYFLHWRFAHLSEVFNEMVHQNVPELFKYGVLGKAMFGCSMVGFNYVAGAIVVGLSFWLLTVRPLWGIWALLTLAMLMVFKPLDRYVLPIVPLLIYGWWRFLCWLHDQLPARWGKYVVAGLFIGGACTNIARMSETIFEQRRVPFLAHYREGRYAAMTQVADLLRSQTPRSAIVLVQPKVGRIMTYLSRRWAMEPGMQGQIDPATQEVYLLTGPSWEESKPQSRIEPSAPPPSAPAWVKDHNYHLSSQIGREIQAPTDREAWRLFRVLP
ncbi:MAG TPA: hypothetical protein VH370_20570 [Humisphaera sp.]|nr:hypothetical protein [Humisphaera sp.]